MYFVYETGRAPKKRPFLKLALPPTIVICAAILFFPGRDKNAAVLRVDATDPRGELALDVEFVPPGIDERKKLSFPDDKKIVVITYPGEKVALRFANAGQGATILRADGQPLPAGMNGADLCCEIVADTGAFLYRFMKRSDTEAALRVAVVGMHFSPGRRKVMEGYDLGTWPVLTKPKTMTKAAQKMWDNRAAYRHPEWIFCADEQLGEFAVIRGHRLASFMMEDKPRFPNKVQWLYLSYAMLKRIVKLEAALRTKNISRGRITVISGFRSPRYNPVIGGSAFSRHLYGDACDFIIDDDGDGKFDDLDGDGKVTWRDAFLIAKLIKELQDQNVIVPGGTGIYRVSPPGCLASVHMDARGVHSTWSSAAGAPDEW